MADSKRGTIWKRVAIVAAILVVVFSLMGHDVYTGMYMWIANHSIAFYHIVFGIGIAIQLIMSVVYFLLIRYIMSKKLNLA